MFIPVQPGEPKGVRRTKGGQTLFSPEELIIQVHQSYEDFAFHRVFSLIYNFCTVEMSSIYMDVLKDRMYCDAKESLSRRSGQTAMYHTLDALVLLLAPILAHTAEEAWAAIAHKSQDVSSVHLALTPKPMGIQVNTQMWDKIMALRDEVLKSLEDLRKNETIGSNQEASVSITVNDEELFGRIQSLGTDNFAALCIVSEVKIEKGPELMVVAQKSPHPKCQRCWNYRSTVGQVAEYPDLCSRCAQVVKG